MGKGSGRGFTKRPEAEAAWVRKLIKSDPRSQQWKREFAERGHELTVLPGLQSSWSQNWGPLELASLRDWERGYLSEKQKEAAREALGRAGRQALTYMRLARGESVEEAEADD